MKYLIKTLVVCALAGALAYLLVTYWRDYFVAASVGAFAFVAAERVVSWTGRRVCHVYGYTRDRYREARCAKRGHAWGEWWGHPDAGGEITCRYRRCDRCGRSTHEDGDFIGDPPVPIAPRASYIRDRINAGQPVTDLERRWLADYEGEGGIRRG